MSWLETNTINVNIIEGSLNRGLANHDMHDMDDVTSADVHFVTWVLTQSKVATLMLLLIAST